MTARRILVSLGSITLALALLMRPVPVLACSPPFEQPTIKALGPAQVVVVGMTGERIAGGRLFHVSRWFNGRGLTTPILIDFKEGEPVGDCSYPMGAGVPLIIAPAMEGGRLSADLATLQADPASELGKTYIAEAVSLFGPGVVPVAARVPVDASQEPGAASVPSGPDVTAVAVFLLVSVTSVFVGVMFLARLRSHQPG